MNSFVKKFLIYALAPFFALLFSVLGFVLYTTSGARLVLDTVSSKLTDVLTIKADITDGSIAMGLSLDDVAVLVPDIVSVRADSLQIKSSGLYDVLALGTYYVKNLESQNLVVELLIKSSDSAEDDEATEDEISDDIFRLKFPLKILIDRLHLDNFAYLSDIVDVKVAMFEGKLKAFDSTAQLVKGISENIDVHLKSEGDDLKSKDNVKVSLPANENNKNTGGTSKKVAEADNEPCSTQTGENKDTSKDCGSALSGSKTAHADSSSGEKNSESLKSQKGIGKRDLDNKNNDLKDTNVINNVEKEHKDQKDTDKGSDDYIYSGRDGQIEKLFTIHLPLDAYVSDLEVKNARYHQDGFDTGIFDAKAQASFVDTLVKVKYLKVKHQLGSVNVKGTMLFDNYYDLDFIIDGRGEVSDYTHDNYEGLLYGLEGKGTVTGSLCDINLDAVLLNPDKTHVIARFNALSPELSLKGRVKSSVFAWPLLTDTPKARGSDLKLAVSGSLINGLDTSLAGVISGYGLKDFKASLTGLVTTGHIDIKKLNLNGLYEGSALQGSYTGLFDYEKEIGLDGSVYLNLSDASFINNSLSGPLDLNANLRIYLDSNDVLSSPIDIREVKSALHLNKSKALIQGSAIKGSIAESLELGSVIFIQNNNALNVSGAIGRTSNLQGTFNLYNLSLIEPALSGDVAGSLKVTGSLEDLDVNINSKSDRIKVSDATFNDINLNVFFRTKDTSFGLTGLVSSIRPGGNLEALKQCVLDVHGSLKTHDANFICAGNNTVYLDYKGALDETVNRYTGSVNELVINNVKGISFSLHDKTGLSYSLADSRGSIDAFTLTGNVGTLSVSKTTFASGILKSDIDIKNLDLKYARLFMPKGYNLKGKVNASASFDINNLKISTEGFIKTSDTVFSAPSVLVPVKDISLTFKGSDESFNTNLDFALRRNLGQGRVKLGIHDIKNAKTLKGFVDISGLDLSLVSQLGQVFNAIEGFVNVKGDIGGSVEKPLFFGDIKAKGNAEPRYDIGQIEDFDINLKAEGYQGRLDGFVNLNGQKLNIDGDLNWLEGAHGQMSFNARSLPAFLAGYGAAIADINVKAHLDESIDVEGTVHIPKAQLTVKGLSQSGVGVSKDEIVIGSLGTRSLVPKSKSQMQSSIDMKVTMGSEVNLKAMGLDALVTGGVDILKSKNSSDVKGVGTISLKDGKIELYGHHFYVVKADTIFNGNIANPKLDVEVIADSDELEDDVEVGVRITGEASDPKIELFSRPSMSQNEILSYILYGHGLEKSSAAQDTNNGALLLGLGLSSTTSLVNSIVGVFGIQDVQVGTSGSGDEAQVSVQGYLTRKIRISYGYGIYNAVGEFKLRYELVRKLYAEFVSSVDQAVDLVYSFEFN